MKKHLVVASALALLTCASYAHAGDHKKDFPECGTKTTVAVDRFKTENISVGWWNNDVALNSREVAVDELVQSGCFRVLERDEGSVLGAGISNEKILSRSGEGKQGSKVARKHGVKIADNLVSYALVGASKDNSGFGIGGLGGGHGGFGGVGGGFKKSDVTLACKLIDTSSSEILASARVKAGDTSFSVGASGGGYGGGNFGAGGLGYFRESKVGKMMSNAIHKCTVELAKSTGR
jgi:curli biogenesis system outer membrane secretion channel CsgG